MHNRERISDIVDSMLDYFEVDSFGELDSLMQMELITELEDCLAINIPLSVCGSDLQRKAFIDAVLEIYEYE
jgi:acyl carrier protein